ncbi:MAG: hypothetical protein GWO07_05150 [Candidatus Dadabacteria bacterium]|nr:hypothetical protein [Candidatus Dadabacteria bacterium]NIV41264.1 hypothetical protein [Candidatus Dadabacteria bacterium]NIX15107.1 hypothetical protein [Candidatus Dadabacteria bacterium]
MNLKIAYFISPHGFGHAARAAAIMDSISNQNNNIEFEIFTTVPQWFFTNSGIRNFKYYDLLTDIGLVQKTPLQEDLDGTIAKLDEFIPFDDPIINNISNKLYYLDCKLILSDISPLGLQIAAKANIPSVLIENFTWDWIYSQYNYESKTLDDHISYLSEIYDAASFKIKTQPVCFEGKSDLLANPVSRKPKSDSFSIKTELEIPMENKIVMITMGGIPSKYNFIDKLESYKDITFIIPGGSDYLETRNNLLLIPHKSDFFHPDLINASDAVVGKVGYSTLAEVYNSGVPFGYILRPQFPESDALHRFIKEKMQGIEIPEDLFYSGKWLKIINKLLVLPKIERKEPNGADQIAEFINKLIV